EEARSDAAAARRRWEEDLAREREAYLVRLEREAAVAAARIADRVLVDLADADVNERAVRVFLERLEAAGDEMLEPLREAGGPLHIATPHRLSKTLREALRTALEARLGRTVAVDFAERKDIVL